MYLIHFTNYFMTFFLFLPRSFIHQIYSVETLTGIKFKTWTLGVFVKNPETGRLLFFFHTFWRIWFFHICSWKLGTTPNFFFQMEES
jgi:hypothetical protein